MYLRKNNWLWKSNFVKINPKFFAKKMMNKKRKIKNSKSKSML